VNRRWNGWGDPAVDYPLPASAAAFLHEKLGDLHPTADATIAEVLNSVPPSRLPEHPLVSRQEESRLRHACGQSLPDWLAMRSGQILAFPDGVALPKSDAEVHELLLLASHNGWQVIPYGGGTSVAGHINPLPGTRPVLTLDMSRLNKLISLDQTSRLAWFEAGITGPELEKQLNASGFSLGHFPQSFELSTLGGWIATRSIGQQSYYYGRIEDLFAGGHIETLRGPLDLPPLPASAAGPDLRQIVLGSEGRLGVITQAAVRIRPIPQTEGFYGVFFHDWQSGVAAVRELAQSDLILSMLRLSNAQETATTLILAGKERLVATADQGLRLFNYGATRCLLIYGVTGNTDQVRQTKRAVGAVCRRYGGLPVGSQVGKIWVKSRFHTPYLRNTLWEQGIAIDTLETALPWTQVEAAADAMQNAIRQAGESQQEKVLVFAHLSHLYPDGASIYITYLFRRLPDPQACLALWQGMKAAASKEILRHKGTISHQHGVGRDHAPYLAAEKSPVGIQLLHDIFQAADPHGLLNPGKLLPAAKDRVA
jgi:alkyldihydroxyacetonephosphate synthase